MRRPRFTNWARNELQIKAERTTFSLRKIASLAQAKPSLNLAPMLYLYAHEDGCIDKLLTFIYEPDLKEEYLTMEHHLGMRSVERLALRGTPMMTIPQDYRDVFASYERAYHAPERIEQEKRDLREIAYELMLKTGSSPAEISHALNLEPGNLHAFLVRGDVHRFTLETAREITLFLTSI